VASVRTKSRSVQKAWVARVSNTLYNAARRL